MISSYRLCAAALSGALCAAPAAAQDFSRMIVFGDSLVDTGQLVDPGAALGAVPGTDGRLRFTNRLATLNFGDPYSQIVSTRLGFGDLNPSQPATFGALPAQTTGLNYAVGGYRAQNVLGSITSANAAVTPPLTLPTGQTVAQVVNDGFLAGSNAALAQGALVLISAGGNDIRDVANVLFDQTGAVATSTISTDTAANAAAMQNAASQVAQGAQALAGAGAALIVVVNSPDLGDIPEADFDAAQGAAAGVANADQIGALRTQATDAYNAALAQQLAAVNGNAVVVDVNSLFAQVVADPARFGLAATDSAGQPLDQTAVCFNAGEVTQIQCVEDATHGAGATPNPLALLFNDGIHPTIAGHALAADAVTATLQGPKDVALLPFAGLSAIRGGAQAFEGASESVRGHAPGSAAPFLTIGATFAEHGPRGGTAAGDSVALAATLGGTYVVVDGVVVGAGVGFNHIDGETAGAGLVYNAKAFYGGAFAAAEYGPAFGGVEINAGAVDYESIERSVQVGATRLRTDGDSDGFIFGVSARAGAAFDLAPGVSAGPVARLSYRRSAIDGFAERGDAGAVMRFSDQTATSTLGSVGAFLDISGALGGAKTRLRVEAAYANEFGDGGGSFTASPANVAGGFTAAGRGAPDAGARLGASFGVDFGFAEASLNYSLQTGDDTVHGGGVTVNMPF